MKSVAKATAGFVFAALAGAARAAEPSADACHKVDLVDRLTDDIIVGIEDIEIDRFSGTVLASAHDRRALEVRGRWLSRAWQLDEDETRARLERHRHLGEEAADADEICLWFEHDLYDQSALVELLARLDASGAAPSLLPRMRLVTLDGHPSVERFVGLGQLRPDALPDLYAARVSITPGHLRTRPTRHTGPGRPGAPRYEGAGCTWPSARHERERPS